MVNSAPLCLQRKAQLHHDFHQVTPCLIKVRVAKLSPLKIPFIIKTAGYRQIGEGLTEGEILPAKCAATLVGT